MLTASPESHLRLCRAYQRHLREQGIAPSEGRQVFHLGAGKSNSPNTEMGYEKSSSSPLLAATAAVDGMHESAVPVSTRTRSGECKFKIRSEKASVECPCQAGEFDIPESVSGWVDIRCNNCAHLIGSHRGCPKDSEAAGAGGATPVGHAAGWWLPTNGSGNVDACNRSYSGREPESRQRACHAVPSVFRQTP